MDERILKWIYDIDFAIKEIDSYFEGGKMDFSDYKKNMMLKRAIERDLEIRGEAVNRILNRDVSFKDKISDAKSIIGLRNQVIHAYDNVSDENIWSILINYLPKLKNEVSKLISENK
ncbi:HepT-like ribonuclease domain-containing protein [Mariniflexile sp.]|uniref:HepT-like ribonuclease domain-containing protein n=2 Tax=Mariniflexile sp. TaxID=1979402 RepID=UPI004047AB71